jgi:small-conductance mechanosensitive channel
VVRALQIAGLLAATFAILLVWGLFDLASLLIAWFAGALPTLGRLTLTLVLIAGALLGTDLLESWITSYAQGTDQINEHQVGIVFRVLQVVLLIAAGLAILSVWNFDLSGLLVGAGFLGIVVGMAARQTLGSLIAGFVLMFSRPFEIGDWVEIGEAEGIVTDITIINTRLRNFDGETVVIPNDTASNSQIVNRTERDRLRLRLDVGIDYEADLERAEEIAEEALSSLEEIRRVPAPQVVPKSFGDSGIGLELRFWIDKPSARRRWRAHGSAVRAVKSAFDREGIKIPYPQRELTGREETGGFRVASDGDGSRNLPDNAPESPSADDEDPSSGT